MEEWREIWRYRVWVGDAHIEPEVLVRNLQFKITERDENQT